MPRAETGEKPILHDCPKCGAPVACGMTNGEDTCWCLALPPALPMPANDSGFVTLSVKSPDCVSGIVLLIVSGGPPVVEGRLKVYRIE